MKRLNCSSGFLTELTPESLVLVIISDVSYEIRQSILKHNHLNRLRVDAVTRSHVSFTRMLISWYVRHFESGGFPQATQAVGVWG